MQLTPLKALEIWVLCIQWIPTMLPKSSGIPRTGRGSAWKGFAPATVSEMLQQHHHHELGQLTPRQKKPQIHLFLFVGQFWEQRCTEVYKLMFINRFINQRCINRFFFLPSPSFDLNQLLYLHISESLSRLWGEISHWAEQKVEEKGSWKTGIFTNDRIFITNTFKKRLHLLDHW